MKGGHVPAKKQAWHEDHPRVPRQGSPIVHYVELPQAPYVFG